MTQPRACVLGGTGFVGHRLAAELVKAGYQVTIISRHRERHRDLLTLPGVRVVTGDVFDYAFLLHEIEGADVVINLVAILNEGRGWSQKFSVAHIQLTEIVLEACRNTGVGRYLHMSGLHANENAPSRFLQTKGRAEDIAHAAGSRLKVTSFRPATIFGPRDSFINRFAGLLDLSLLLFPLPMGESRMQPVYVGDVAQCFVRSIRNHKTYGQRYDLCGPKTYSLMQIVDYIACLKGKNVRVVSMGRFVSRLQAQLLQLFPGKPFTVDNYLSLTVDSICRQGFPEIFDIKPTPMEDVVPTYIAPDYRGPYDGYRCKVRD